MAKKSKSVALEGPTPVVKMLDGERARYIGHYITTWSVVEHELDATIHLSMGVQPKIGRIAASQGRARERLIKVRDLLEARNTQHDIEFDDLATRLKAADELRDFLAHSIWQLMHLGDDIAPRRMGGYYQGTPGKPRRSRRHLPELQPGWTVEKLKTEVFNVYRLCDEVTELRLRIKALLDASPDKSPP